MQTVTLARHAMGTRFEIVLHGENPSRLRAAGEEALAEIERLEGQLSLYKPSSEIAQVNAAAARQPVRVTPAVFRLLQQADQLHRESGGAFDITIAPLVRCWGFMDGSGSLPDPGDVERVRRHVGMQHVMLDEENLTVQFDAEGVMLDLGAIGKGYAIDCAVETLREAGAESALIHGGTSTVYALGGPPGNEPWKVAIESPAGLRLLAAVPLHNEAMSVSAVWGKSFAHDGKNFGHVLDPRTGRPVAHTLLAAVVVPSATETDALSTALLVVGSAGHDKIAQLRPSMRTLLLTPQGDLFHAESKGIALLTPESVENPSEND
ncbi:MAG TPA: FAD:protein FMN transferase [Candidatus Saccharimonadales bacterium]|nr:FAD:protein FMN transferase [Candidatus Saccharimonadales bacterium]